MPILTVNNAKFYYELHGEGEPLVLIAGLKADHNGWLPVLSDLVKKFQVLIFDNRGAGQTSDAGDAFDVEMMADDVMELIQKLKLDRPHIVGHSLGGAIAQVIAKKYAENINSIVLCNTFTKFNETAKEAFAEILKLHNSGTSEAEIMESIIPWAFSPKFLNQEIIEVIRKSSNENPYPQSSPDYERQFNALCEFDSRSWISSLNVPALILGSDEDKIATLNESKELADSISGSKFVNLPTGHASQVEQPKLFFEALNNFYDERLCHTSRIKCG